MDQVHRDGQPITVLKRGKPLVKVIPADEPYGVQDLTGTILHQDEDIFSTGSDWSADS
jgi:antitoxin (DNA-binding transcriptional repressor) of toxin-antitoxin stability system